MLREVSILMCNQYGYSLISDDTTDVSLHCIDQKLIRQYGTFSIAKDICWSFPDHTSWITQETGSFTKRRYPHIRCCAHTTTEDIKLQTIVPVITQWSSICCPSPTQLICLQSGLAIYTKPRQLFRWIVNEGVRVTPYGLHETNKHLCTNHLPYRLIMRRPPASSIPLSVYLQRWQICVNSCNNTYVYTHLPISHWTGTQKFIFDTMPEHYSPSWCVLSVETITWLRYRLFEWSVKYIHNHVN